MTSSWLTSGVLERHYGHDHFDEAMQDYAELSDYTGSWNTWQMDGKFMAARTYNGEHGPWGHARANQYFAALRVTILEARFGPEWRKRR